ncbi:hypothetical protein J6590_054853 [Homalodisca vitripennis]|nr:hypothetical protein J6590_054853 [Homalodisca vitripennis]
MGDQPEEVATEVHNSWKHQLSQETSVRCSTLSRVPRRDRIGGQNPWGASWGCPIYITGSPDRCHGVARTSHGKKCHLPPRAINPSPTICSHLYYGASDEPRIIIFRQYLSVPGVGNWSGVARLLPYLVVEDVSQAPSPE